jgi:hypothetical protein
MFLYSYLVSTVNNERACIVIKWMNWIHSRYGGKIKMPHMAYTLCILTYSALRSIDKYN